jgi:hypothetical protein
MSSRQKATPMQPVMKNPSLKSAADCRRVPDGVRTRLERP